MTQDYDGNNPRRLLEKARGLILLPQSWTKGAYARDQHGQEVGAWDETAVCFCLAGAMMRAGPLNWNRNRAMARTLVMQALGYRGNILPYNGLIAFNDHPERKHAEVIQLLDYTMGAL